MVFGSIRKVGWVIQTNKNETETTQLKNCNISLCRRSLIFLELNHFLCVVGDR